MDDEELFNSVLGPAPAKPQLQAQQPAMDTGVPGSGTSDDDIFSSVLGQPASAAEPGQASQPPAQMGTPDNPLRGVVEFSNMINKAREVGRQPFRDAALGHDVKEGRMTLEEAEQKIKEDDHYALLSEDIEKYQQQTAVPWATAIALATARSLPMLEESLKPFGVGAVAGGGTMAATGVGSVVSVPVGVGTGTTLAAGWAADMIIGQEYLTRRRAGMDHNSAAAAANISGVIQGTLQGLQLGNAAKVPINAAKSVLAAHAATVGKFFTEGFKFGASQLAFAEAGTAVKLATDAIAGTVAKVPGVIPTLESATKEFEQTFNETLNSSIGLFLGGKLIGGAAGLSLKALVKKAAKAHLEKQQEKLNAQAGLDAEGNPVETGATPDGESSKADSAKSKASGESKTSARKREISEKKLDKRIEAEREINRIIEASTSIFYTAQDETRFAESKRIQTIFKRMVKNSEILDDKTKVRLLSRAFELDGVNDLLREGQAFIDEQWAKEKANAQAEAAAKLQGAIASGRMKGKKAAMPASVQQSLKWYEEFFTPPKLEKRAKGTPKRAAGEGQAEIRQAALDKATDYVTRGHEEEVKRIGEQVDKLEKGELAEIFNEPAELLEKRRIAMQAQAFWSGAMDPASVVDLAGEITGMVDEGKSTFLDRKKAEAEKLINMRSRVTEGVQGAKPVIPSQDAKGPRQNSIAGKISHSLRRTSSSLWDKLLQDTPHDVREKIVADILDFTEVENKEATINIEAVEKMAELYVDAAGSEKAAIKLIRDGADQKKRVELKYTNGAGFPTSEYHTLNELTYLYMALDDPGARPGLLNGNGFTLEGMTDPGHISTQEAVKAILASTADGKYLKLGDALKSFYQWFGPKVANHYLKEYGVKLPMEENYSGTIFHRNLERIKSASDLLNDVHAQAQRSLDPGSVKARSNSKMPIKLVDPFVQVQRHRADMAFWIANSEKARQLSFIFSDTTKDGLRDVIGHKLGSDFNSLIDTRLGFQFHLKPGLIDVGDAAFQTFKSNMATGLLGARIDQAPKQWSSVLAALHKSDYGQFVRGLRGAMDKEKLQGYLSRSELYRDRQNHILPQILEATKDRTFVDAVSGDKALGLKTFFLIPMHKWGDGVGAAVAGFVEYNRVLEAGGTINEAVIAGDRMVDTTQSSSRASQKVPAEMKGGIASLSLAFQKEGIQAINRESGAIRDWYIHKDDKHLARMARTILSIHAAQTIFQAINNAPALMFGDDQEKEKGGLKILGASLGGAYTTTPLIGMDVVDGVLSGWKGNHDPHTIIGGLASDSTRLVKRLWTVTQKMAANEDIEGEEWVKVLKSMAGVASVGTGIPFWGLFKYTELGSKIVEKAKGEQ